MAKALIAFDIFSGFRPQHSVEGGSPKKWQALPAFILIPSSAAREEALSLHSGALPSDRRGALASCV